MGGAGCDSGRIFFWRVLSTSTAPTPCFWPPQQLSYPFEFSCSRLLFCFVCRRCRGRGVGAPHRHDRRCLTKNTYPHKKSAHPRGLSVTEWPTGWNGEKRLSRCKRLAAIVAACKRHETPLLRSLSRSGCPQWRLLVARFCHEDFATERATARAVCPGCHSRPSDGSTNTPCSSWESRGADCATDSQFELHIIWRSRSRVGLLSICGLSWLLPKAALLPTAHRSNPSPILGHALQSHKLLHSSTDSDTLSSSLCKIIQFEPAFHHQTLSLSPAS